MKLAALLTIFLSTLAFQLPSARAEIPDMTPVWELPLEEADPTARPRVDLLGQTRLTFFRFGVQNVPVRSCQRDGEVVRAIKLRVLQNAVRIDRLQVTFGNGQRQTLNMRQFFRPGSESRWIPLRGGFFNRGRCVRSIQVAGSSGFFPPRPALVRFYGLVDDAR